MASHGATMREQIIRDPVHDVIAFDPDRPDERLLFSLLGTAEFQRLRRIRQLGLASLAYPGADHSRYVHSLGVLQTARRMLARLERRAKINPHDRLVCLIASLLHDLGHGPFSHVFERVTGVDHERLTARLILDPLSRTHQLLIRYDPVLPEQVVDLLKGSGTASGRPRSFLNDVISSQLDADRLDYLLRDDLMTGSRYGGYDLAWLLQAMDVDESSGRLVISEKAVSAAEAYLQARYHMYRHVYFHKVVRSAEGMVRLALQRARRLAAQDRLAWPPASDGLAAALRGDRLTTAQFIALDDVSVLSCFKVWAIGDDRTLGRICSGLLERRLFKTIDLSNHPDFAAASEKARRAVLASGGDGGYDVFADEATDTAYNPHGDQAILVCSADGGLEEISQVSPAIASLAAARPIRRLHVSAEYAGAVAGAVTSE